MSIGDKLGIIPEDYPVNIDQNCANSIVNMTNIITTINDIVDILGKSKGKYSISDNINKLNTIKGEIEADKTSIENLRLYYREYYEDIVSADKQCFNYIKMSDYTNDSYSVEFCRDGYGEIKVHQLKELNPEEISDEDSVLLDFYEYIKTVKDTALEDGLVEWIYDSGLKDNVEIMILAKVKSMEKVHGIEVDWDELKKGDITLEDYFGKDAKVTTKFSDACKYIDGIIAFYQGYNDGINNGNDPYASAAVKTVRSTASVGITATTTKLGFKIGSKFGPLGTAIGIGIGFIGGTVIDAFVDKGIDKVEDWYLDEFHSKSVYENKNRAHGIDHINKDLNIKNVSRVS